MTERYSYTTKGRTVTFTDGKGSDYVYSYDEFGRLTQEKNRIDGTQSYTYNENGELKAKKDFEGNVTAVSYDTKTRTRRTQYADGTETVIVYDECGNILSATNESGTLSYAYDKAGLLIKETDSKTGETVSYLYDKAGRRTRLVSRERDISYGYGKNSELLSQKDRLKQLEIHYKYDAYGRETERRFGNGVRQLTFYDKAGRTICIRQVNSSDRLLSGEAYAYDKLGRRSMTVNEKGLVTIYKYDNQSRLETVYYPFNEDIKETARKEADKQGLYFQPWQGTAENYFLSTGELLQLKAVAECIASGRSGAITVNQVVWKESYTYDANGNRTSKTTAWGTVQYAYDAENRLTESGNLGMSESVKYTYDANGNLLRESAARYLKDYTYNAQNRMSFSDVQDSVLNTRNFTEYAYDAFGRRIETKQYLGDYTRNLYDGFSFDVIGKSLLQTSYPMALSEQKYRDARTGHPELVSGSAQTTSGTTSSGRNAAGTEIGTRYRYIDDTPLVPLSEAAAGGSSSAAAGGAKNRSRASSEYVLYSHGAPAAVNSDDGTSYFGTDILGSIRNVTDKYGTVQSEYNYDAFGSPYLGNLENDVGFGYCGKSYDVGTGLYDYGFRDYSPISARFTTTDPIRDGANWFSYVVNDPVNYVDLWGLSTSDSSQSPFGVGLNINLNNGGTQYFGFNSFNVTPSVKNPVITMFNDFVPLAMPSIGSGLTSILSQDEIDSIMSNSNPASGVDYDSAMRAISRGETPRSPENVIKDRINARIRDGSIPELTLEGPCLMRALMGIAETYAGKNLTEEQIKSAITDLMASGKVLSAPANKRWSVQDSPYIILDTMKRLGVDISKMSIIESRPDYTNYETVKVNAFASIRGTATVTEPNLTEPGHYQEGDRYGNLVFDPIDGTSDGGRRYMPEYTRYFQLIINE